MWSPRALYQSGTGRAIPWLLSCPPVGRNPGHCPNLPGLMTQIPAASPPLQADSADQWRHPQSEPPRPKGRGFLLGQSDYALSPPQGAGFAKRANHPFG